jgi:hypothetical protein
MTPLPLEPEQFGRALTDADLLRLKGAPVRSRLPRPAKDEQYLGGPVPLAWLSRAAGLPGKALHLGIALWFAAVRSRGKDPTVALTDALADRFGLRSRTTRTRALDALRGADLVRVENRTGRAPLVTILPSKSQDYGTCEAGE